MSEDMLNVMGSFSETALDCIEKQNEEIEQLQQENRQLKEKYNIRSKAYNNILLENASLHTVLDEIREYIEHEWFKRGQLGIIDKSFQEWQLKDILQILDKVKK